MNERQWLSSSNPLELLDLFKPSSQHRISDRKLRLFCVACAQLYGEKHTWADEWADGHPSGRFASDDPYSSAKSWCAVYPLRVSPQRLPEVAELLRDIAGNPFKVLTLPQMRKLVPIGPFEIDAGTITHGFSDETYCPWLTDTVKGLAEQIYQEREFSLMPILGDALEDAGCTDRFILAHCRSHWINVAGESVLHYNKDVPHVRGCHVLDLLLGKE